MPTTPPLTLNAQELICLLSHPYTLKRQRSEFEGLHGGFGEAIAISSILACEALIEFYTRVSCLMQQQWLSPTEYAAKLAPLLDQLKKDVLFPELLEDAIIRPLPDEDALALYRHHNYFKSNPSARQILTHALPLSHPSSVCERIMLHMNQTLTKLVSREFKEEKEYTFLLIDSKNAHLILKDHTSPFSFRAEDIKLRFKGTMPFELLSQMQTHLSERSMAEERTISLPAPQPNPAIRAAISIGIFAAVSYGIKQVADYFQYPPHA